MNISIVPLIDEKEHGSIIQSKKFSLSVQITNDSESPSPEFDIQQIVMSSAEGHDIHEDFGRKSFHVGIINPGEHEIVKIGENGHFMYGLVYLEATMVPRTPSTTINFYQKSPFTKEKVKCKGVNKWYDFLYIKTSSEDTQNRSAIWMMRLTVVIAAFTIIQVVSILMDHYISK